jgi:hypothetical protein
MMSSVLEFLLCHEWLACPLESAVKQFFLRIMNTFYTIDMYTFQSEEPPLDLRRTRTLFVYLCVFMHE